MIYVGLLGFVLLSFIGNVRSVPKESCEKCVNKDDCPLFGNMTKQEQMKWMENFTCNKPQGEDRSKLFGFAPVAKGDYICCPAPNVWGIEGQEQPNANNRANFRHSNTYTKPNDDMKTPTDDINQRNNIGNTDTTQPMDGSSNNSPEDSYSQSRHPSKRNRRPDFNTKQNQYPPNQNPYFMKNPNINNNSLGRYGNRGSGQFSGGSANQCSDLIRSIPDPESGCCGLDVTGGNRKIGVVINAPRSRDAGQNNWNIPEDGGSSGFSFNPLNWPSWFPRPQGFSDQGAKAKRAANDKVNVTVDTRIAGGRETDLEQFPWTVLLQTTFSYGTKESTFNCGGSIISSRYILTAAHCVNEEGATVSSVEIYLAEYDKRTFPRDCVNTLSDGRKCIENIVMYGESVLSHPDYDDQKLQNDIAIIRLKRNAPYTDYIRPICLPPIDIDNPDFSNLKLSVSGWGRNGLYNSDVKQSTVVNLVPQSECKKSYPYLTRRHLCAAGYTGEDTCKGDSGGPLMMVYEGRYFVSGIVSGKRADSPCGTSVPSLYTNVYQYRDWIMNNVKFV